jgi:hypothetical protein
MSHSNRVPDLRRPFAICYGCDTVAALTTISADGWALVFRHHRMFGYLCPTCRDPQPAAEVDEAAARIVRQQSRSQHPSHLPG